MKVKELLEPINQEQSKEILRAELVRRKIQIKMGQFGLWRRKKEFERSSRLFLNQHGGFCGRETGGGVGGREQKSERPQKFCGGRHI